MIKKQQQQSIWQKVNLLFVFYILICHDPSYQSEIQFL